MIELAQAILTHPLGRLGHFSGSKIKPLKSLLEGSKMVQKMYFSKKKVLPPLQKRRHIAHVSSSNSSSPSEDDVDEMLGSANGVAYSGQFTK